MAYIQMTINVSCILLDDYKLLGLGNLFVFIIKNLY